MSQTMTSSKWPGFGYAPVRGLADRLIARQLRTARKNMARFFQERGMFEFADRMRRIRNSNQSMMAKNRAFQEVLDDYAQRVNPKPSPAVSLPQAADLEAAGGAIVGLPDSGVACPVLDEPEGDRADAADGVRDVAAPDAGPVIEE